MKIVSILMNEPFLNYKIFKPNTKLAVEIERNNEPLFLRTLGTQPRTTTMTEQQQNLSVSSVEART